MKGFVEGAKHHDVIGQLIDIIRADEPVASEIDQMNLYNSLQVFHAHGFVADPAGKFEAVAEMIAERLTSDQRENDHTDI